ncbi:MAG: alpha/beta hydrolase [Planctomycetaceae bacterium]
MTLDPQAAALLLMLEQNPPPAIWEIPLDVARANVIPVPGPPQPVENVESRIVSGPQGDIPVRIYTPPADAGNSPSPVGVTLFFHGGGWVTGNLDTHDALARRLCVESRSLLVAVDYGLAPERKFPVPVEEAAVVARWAVDEYHLPIAVTGDSAGANIAAALCLLLRDTDGPDVAAQALLYPATEYAFETDSYRQNLGAAMLSRESMQWFWGQYLATPEDGKNPLASPLLAPSLAGLPPAQIVIAEHDVLRDDGLHYANRLEEFGVPVERLYCPGMIHGFLRRLNVFDHATPVLQSVGSFLNRSLSRSALRS